MCEEAKSDISVSSVGLVTKASLDGGALLRVKKDSTRFKAGRSDKRIGLGDGVRSWGLVRGVDKGIGVVSDHGGGS